MPLKKSTGNMYPWVTHTWNPIKGDCGYGCKYCYTHRWGNQKPIHIDEKELRVNLGTGNFIFICSGCDLFHPAVSDFWIAQVVCHVREYYENRYLLHTKNPKRILDLAHNGFYWPGGLVICVTVESDKWHQQMGCAPTPLLRIDELSRIGDKKMITVEPVMQFTPWFYRAILKCKPEQVNIGADSGGNNLPEPSREELEEFIELLAPHTKVYLKKNLRRILPRHRLYGGENG